MFRRNRHIRVSEMNVLRKLNTWAKLKHPIMRKHILHIGLGALIATSGSAMALNVEHQHLLPHPLWDFLAYLIHGLGSWPILKHGEIMWAYLAGE